MTFTPYQVQVEARQAFWDYDGDKGAMVVLPTGVGKTALANWIATEFLDQGRRVLWLAHRQELLNQPLASLTQYFPGYVHRAGIVQAERDEPHCDLVYASKDTVKSDERLARVLDRGRPGLVVVDEAHLSSAKTWTKILDTLRGVGTRFLGLTATPDRNDEKDLGHVWDIIYSYGIVNAIDNGLLIPPYAAEYDVPGLDLSSVSGRQDYTAHELWAELAKVHIVEHTVEAIGQTYEAARLPFRDHSKHLRVGARSTLLFTATIEQAELTAAALQAAGYSAVALSEKTKKSDRASYIRDFETGEIQIICNPVLLTVGTDLPRASCNILVRPTKSWVLYVQMTGRALRTYPGQHEAFILDLAGGATRLHSLISAPVFVGEGCEGSPDRQHRFLLDEPSGEGICQYCKTTVACGRRGGAHRFKEGHCVSCDREQCPKAPDKQHVYIPWEDGTRQCIHCMVQISDGLRSLLHKRGGCQDQIPRAAWNRLACPGEIWAVHMGSHGVFFSVKAGESWLPMWYPMVGAPKRLSRGAVPAAEVKLLAGDVFRRVQRVNGLVGGRSNSDGYRRGYLEAEKIARMFLLWRAAR